MAVSANTSFPEPCQIEIQMGMVLLMQVIIASKFQTLIRRMGILTGLVISVTHVLRILQMTRMEMVCAATLIIVPVFQTLIRRTGILTGLVISVTHVRRILQMTRMEMVCAAT